MSSFYAELAELPSYRSADFIAANALRVTLAISDHTRNVKRTLVKTIIVDPASDAVIRSPSEELADVVASTISPSGRRRAVLKEISDPLTAGGKKRFVEIWSGDRLEAVRDVTESHGAFYSDEHIATLVFNASENGLLYTAECQPATEPSREKFKYIPHFGESFAPKRNPTLFLFLWQNNRAGDTKQPSGEATVLSTLVKVEVQHTNPVPVFFAKAVFSGDNSIYATGYEYSSDGRLLGIVYCQNRPAGIWRVDIPHSKLLACSSELISRCSSSRLTEKERSCRSVRIADNTRIFWLSNSAGGPHASTASLHSLDSSTGTARILINVPREPEPGAFPGLYIDSLPKRPFLRLGQQNKELYIVASSPWGCQSTVLLISADDGSITELTPRGNGPLYSWVVLASDGRDKIVCSRSSPTSPPELVLGYVSQEARPTVEQWQVLDQAALSTSVKAALSKLESEVIKIPGHHPVETIVIKQRHAATIPPTINNPHGGPHSVTTTSFQAGAVAFALAGYTFAMPNYTGSLGYGEQYVRKLLGQCGTLDVNDCIASMKHLVKLGISKEGPGSQLIIGGSHGGFLAGHLIGQFPDTFSAASIRNPVIAAGELSTSDIPDWYFFEFGVDFGPTSLMTPKIYETLTKASPISHVGAVKAPVLLLVGEKDQRVAPTQGKNYYHALKARGKQVELLCFPEESHPLDGVESARVSWEETEALFHKVKA